MQGEETKVESRKLVCAHCDLPITSDWYVVDRSKLNLPALLLHAECVEPVLTASGLDRAEGGRTLVNMGDETKTKPELVARVYHVGSGEMIRQATPADIAKWADAKKLGAGSFEEDGKKYVIKVSP